MKRRGFLQSLFSLPLIGAVREAPAVAPPAIVAPARQVILHLHGETFARKSVRDLVDKLEVAPRREGYWVGEGGPVPVVATARVLTTEYKIVKI